MVYVDNLLACLPNKNWKYRHSCHLFADTETELHTFAAKLGLRLSWFQSRPKHRVPHYDLTAGKRAKAIALGATQLTAMKTIAFWREKGWL